MGEDNVVPDPVIGCGREARGECRTELVVGVHLQLARRRRHLHDPRPIRTEGGVVAREGLERGRGRAEHGLDREHVLVERAGRDVVGVERPGPVHLDAQRAVGPEPIVVGPARRRGVVAVAGLVQGRVGLVDHQVHVRGPGGDRERVPATSHHSRTKSFSRRNTGSRNGLRRYVLGKEEFARPVGQEEEARIVGEEKRHGGRATGPRCCGSASTLARRVLRGS